MDHLYLDATAEWSNPVESGRKVLDGGGTWANPDSGRLALDATGEWSAPELRPANIADASWKDIEQLSELAAKNPQRYSKYLGQTKTIDMSSLADYCKDVTVMIIGIGQDVDPQGNKLGFTFQLRDGMPYEDFCINKNSQMANGVGWRGCYMRSTLIPKIKDAMPEELSSRLKTMVKKTHLTCDRNSKNWGSLTETQDELALLSQVEVYGEAEQRNVSGVPEGEGEWYQWYEQNNTDAARIIKCSHREGDYNAPDGSWLRTINYWWELGTTFRQIEAFGALGSVDVTYGRSACACFCV